MVLCPNFFRREFAKFLTPKKREIEKMEHNFNFQEEKRSKAKCHWQKKERKGWMRKGTDELMYV
jgi:hypothetical protein